MVQVSSLTQRLIILVTGIVQGVGFRPFVYGLAVSHRLTGTVRNDSAGVTIEVEGDLAELAAFVEELSSKAPPLARIDQVTAQTIPTRGDASFTILSSHKEHTRRALISPDVATCQDCLRELFDPQDRRYWYPFINCTNCGPRFTIIQDVPYDRGETTMRVFEMCPRCRAEYEDPLNRRFHAQPNACPECGPGLRLIRARDAAWTGSPVAFNSQDARAQIFETARRLLAGEILAIKGLGGYHLACDALNAPAVERLRQSKHREAKPFALMAADVETARRLCFVNDAEKGLLESRQRPVVLLRKRADDLVAAAVAPGLSTLGIMLPYTPLHFLLLRACGELAGPERLTALVMTSGNVSDEPIAYQDEDALERLAPIADSWLILNREIHIRCDDSVARVAAGGEQVFRRSRGYAPEPVPLAFTTSEQVLAVGGHLKNTFCLVKENQAFVSHHIGDLENLETLRSFQEGIAHFQRLFDIHPQAIAYDLHPGYLSTQYALNQEAAQKVSVKIGVQHHHAHIASVLAEHGLNGPVIGVAADGTGYGTDGAVWGGEILVANLHAFRRSAHLAYLPLPGGEQAVHQPWRMAAAYLRQAFGEDFIRLGIPFTERMDRASWRLLAQSIAHGVNCPPTSSLGRLFDAVAALVGLQMEAAYEGQAAIALETEAMNLPEAVKLPERQGGEWLDPYPFAILPGEPSILDVRPMIRAIVRDIQHRTPAARIAVRFHVTVAALLAAACRQARIVTGIEDAALSGGVFQNRLLLEQLVSRLEADGFRVWINRKVPPNDGGISLGQAAVAAARIAEAKIAEGAFSKG